MGLAAVFSWTYVVKRLRNLGYSLLATALRTEAGAQPPGFTEMKNQHLIFNECFRTLALMIGCETVIKPFSCTKVSNRWQRM